MNRKITVKRGPSIFLLLVVFSISFASAEDNIDLSKGKILDEKRIQLFPKIEPQDRRLHTTEFRLLGPLVVGKQVPFVIDFLSSAGEVLETYRLKSDLIISIESGDSLQVTFNNRTYTGKGAVVIPSGVLSENRGPLKGYLTLNTIRKNMALKIAARKITEKEGTLLTESEISVLYGEAAGALFTNTLKELTAGDTMEMNVHIFNYRGDLIREPDSKLYLDLVSEHPIQINGKKASGSLIIEQDKFIKGKAKVVVKTEKCGKYTIALNDGTEFDGKGPGIWNRVSFDVQPGKKKETILDMPEKIPAGREFKVDFMVRDSFKNTIETRCINLAFEPFPRNMIFIQGRRITGSETSVQICEGGNSLVITKAGDYQITTEMGKSKIRVEPLEAVSIGADVPAVIEAGTEHAIAVAPRDKYGNATKLDVPLIMKVPAGLIAGEGTSAKEIEITFNKNEPYSFPVKPVHSGFYTVTVTGYGKGITKRVRVTPGGMICSINNDKIQTRTGGSILVPFTVMDQFNNAPEGNEKITVAITHDQDGRVGASGQGFSISSRKSGTGTATTVLDLRTVRNRKNYAVVLYPVNTRSLTVSAGTGNSVTLENLKSARLPAAKTGPREITKHITGNLSSEREQMKALNSLIARYPTTEKITMTWNSGSKGSIRNILLYYPTYGRLDYQEWDTVKNRRIRRVIWKGIRTPDIREAVQYSRSSFPGDREVY